MARLLRRKTDEPMRRYHEARSLIDRVVAAYRREGWEDGETIDAAISAAGEWLTAERTEEEITAEGAGGGET